MTLSPQALAPGQEQHEAFNRRGKRIVQYDYRHPNGDLFSCVRPDLESCREARDEWIKTL